MAKLTTHPVNSSNIKAVGYDPKQRLLQVDFHNGAIYQYKPVQEAAYLELVKAESIGKYFNAHISTNKNITYERIEKKS